jgi:uncharacterized protein YndB with AHSA1/START domain
MVSACSGAGSHPSLSVAKAREAMASRVDRASKTIRAPASVIYQALTDPDALREWLPPKGMSGTIENFDLRQEGGYRMTLTYDGRGSEDAGKTEANKDVVDVVFAKIVPDHEIVQLAMFQSEDSAFAGAMTMTWTLTSNNDATEVTITAEDVPEGIKQSDHIEGLNASLDNLARYVTGAP